MVFDKSQTIYRKKIRIHYPPALPRRPTYKRRQVWIMTLMF